LSEVEHSGVKEQAGLLPEKVGNSRGAEACWMRGSGFSQIRVRARPGRRTRGVLLAGPLAMSVVLGRGGVRANKFEGDGATPRGRFRLIRLWWRGDRHPRPRTLLPVRRISSDLAWCEDTADRRYNRPFRRSAAAAGTGYGGTIGSTISSSRSTTTRVPASPGGAARFFFISRGRTARRRPDALPSPAPTCAASSPALGRKPASRLGVRAKLL